VNRLVEPEDLEAEVDRLIEILLSKDATAMHCTKYFLDNGADLDYSNVMAFEGAPQRVQFGQGIKDFVERESRDERRKLLDGFWFD